MMSKGEISQQSVYGTLYVVFHGELIFTDVRTSHFIRVRTPHMHEHVFMAGPWLGERHIPADAMLQLFGAAIGGDSIHDHLDQFVIFQNAPGNPGAMPYFEILLPRPRAILPGRLVDFDPTALVIDTPGVTFETKEHRPPSSLDLYPIFQYDLSSAAVPFLGVSEGDGDDFPQWPAGMGTDGYYSLHIFAETDQDLGAGHSQMAFRESAMLLGVQADVEPVTAGSLRDPTDCIPGLLQIEYSLALRDRAVTLAALGQQMRRGDMLQFCPQPAAPHPHRPKKGINLLWLDPGSCGPIGN